MWCLRGCSFGVRTGSVEVTAEHKKEKVGAYLQEGGISFSILCFYFLIIFLCLNKKQSGT